MNWAHIWRSPTNRVKCISVTQAGVKVRVQRKDGLNGGSKACLSRSYLDCLLKFYCFEIFELDQGLAKIAKID